MIISVVDVALVYSAAGSSSGGLQALRTFRLLRILRTLRLLYQIPGLRKLLKLVIEVGLQLQACFSSFPSSHF